MAYAPVHTGALSFYPLRQIFSYCQTAPRSGTIPHISNVASVQALYGR